ncbi:relaxase/mobilization nuclease domain-containing protein [Oscillibacter sp.]|uniref:relaxase/mobilization nuclease domain-containing protein n=1 Tax=Oscillibacter sp. TaxID=1945593 RepID=UPI00289DA95E|nr:relaxase/mobilization nuclease domain-containing protein [Oscillibacter sp.]
MAYTEIHAVTATPDRAISYVLSDKTEKIETEHEAFSDVPHDAFCREDQLYVHYPTLASFMGISRRYPMRSFNCLRENGQGKFQSGGSRAKNGKEPLLYHMTQNFNGRELSQELANEIGMKTCSEVFPNFSFIVTTHTNTNNIHNHFIISAWDNDGKKVNDCLALKRQIRQVSDRLCREYGLSVLDKTAGMKVDKYKDNAGVTRFYEPTERKAELIMKRKDQAIIKDSIYSYRNTLPYEREQYQRKRNCDLIKMDIDSFLPICSSYDELLKRLREIGYTIRAKKKNGDWLAHVSFQPPTADKATREDKIGDFYLRENLMAFLEEQVQREEQSYETTDAPEIPYFADYVYGETDLASIDLDYRSVKVKDDYSVVPRTEGEKKLITSALACDAKAWDMMDMVVLSNLIALQLNEKNHRRPYFKRTEEQRLVAQINDSLDCLRFTEKHGLFSYEQFFASYKNYQRIYNDDMEKRKVIVDTIAKLKDAATLPEKAQALEQCIHDHRGNAAYIFDERRFDEAELEKCRALMRSYKIETPEKQQQLRDTVAGFEARLQKVDVIIDEVRERLQQIDLCVRTYDRIDIAAGKQDVDFIRRYEATKRSKSEQADIHIVPEKPKKQREQDRE